jgi:peptidoglycan-associated lipoprotein
MRKRILLAVALVMILPAMFLTTSCAKKKMQTEPVTTIQPEVQKAPDRSAEEAEQARLQEEQLREERLREEQLRKEAAAREAAKKTFVTENIHFEFNSALLADQAQLILKSKADYLHNNSDVTVTVEGHCDDRGTESYNIALGQKRAESVKKFLVALGISTNRMATVSYGEERPLAMGQDETSWAKNRRAQFMIN